VDLQSTGEEPLPFSGSAIAECSMFKVLKDSVAKRINENTTVCRHFGEVETRLDRFESKNPEEVAATLRERGPPKV